MEKIQQHLFIEEESKDQEKPKSVGYSKANVLSAKGKKKYCGIKNHFGPKKEHNKFETMEDQKDPKASAMCVEKPVIVLKIVDKTRPKMRQMLFKQMIT